MGCEEEGREGDVWRWVWGDVGVRRVGGEGERRGRGRGWRGERVVQRSVHVHRDNPNNHSLLSQTPPFTSRERGLLPLCIQQCGSF